MSFEKIAQNITQTTFCQNYYVIIKKEKSAPKVVIFKKKTFQKSKESLNGRKFAQSGHPAC
jgi:hypothetical protein